ncbi:tail-tube assembly protein [Methylophilales phage Melnitz EXVC044M]|nr:tail-tube assembly protein [Methylophilales phage Melnitz-1 EXVC043M]QZI94621.1 tail-tube assembly protein [Methylophilales phage Melnitz-2 EXVC040M]QZI94843.1 tail-tube assembly protein [Methylophilales phage Melnitz EXVC044M]QZI95064.1 tail-tube assembly protein [Methylophilales phage Melnitz-3 EXVC039M]
MANLESIVGRLFSGGGSSRAGNLQYPMDVGHMSRSDHYVQFFINEQIDAKASISGGAVPNSGGPPGSVTYSDRRSRTVERAPTTRASGSITLYMPNQIQVSQKANYGEAEIGLLVAGSIASFNTVSGGLGNIDLGSVADTLKKEGGNTVAKALEGAGATGAVAAKAIASGETTNNRTEMKFEGIDRRSFQFTFRLLPRSPEEASAIQEIVTLFRYHSMPGFTDDMLGRTLKAPSTFDIQYYPEEHLHKIGTSALEAVDVKFGGDRPQFFKDNQPTETELTLTFKELDIVTKEKVARGF